MNLKRNVHLCGAIALSLTLSGVAMGIDFSGGASNPGDWNDPLNWDGGAIPDGSDASADASIGTANFNNVTATLDTSPPAMFDLRIGSSFGTGGGGYVGQLDHSAGTLASNWSFVGVDGDGLGGANVGTYNLSGTATHTATVFTLGLGGSEFDLTASNEGYLNVSGAATLQIASGFNVGRSGKDYGEVNQTGGSISSGNWFNVGDDGATTAVYNMSGGNAIGDQMTIGQTAGSNGTMNLSGTADVTSNTALRVGRGTIPGQQDPNFSKGLLSITGGDVRVNTVDLSVGGDESIGVTPAEGTLSYTSEAGAVSAINVSGNVLLNDGSSAGFSELIVDLESSPVAGDVLLVDLASTGTVTGTFMGLAEGAAVPNSGGRTISYAYGADGNDIALVGGASVPGDADGDGDVDGQDYLILQRDNPAGIADWQSNYPTPLTGAISAVPEPASASLVALGLCLAAMLRRV